MGEIKSVDFYGDAKKVFAKSEDEIRTDERAKVIEELQRYIGTHNRHIFGIGISNILDSDELMSFLIKLTEEQKNEMC